MHEIYFLIFVALLLGAYDHYHLRRMKRRLDEMKSVVRYHKEFLDRELKVPEKRISLAEKNIDRLFNHMSICSSFSNNKIDALYEALGYTYEPSKTVGPRAVRKAEEPTI